MFARIDILLFLLFLFCIATTSTARDLDEMQLVGTGEVHYLKFIKVYDATLYSENFTGNEDILENTVSKCLELHYAVGIEKDDFITAANTILFRQFSADRLDRLQDELTTFHNRYKDVKKGDSYTLCYSKADQTTRLALNGVELVSISEPDFAKIYFSIWLGSTAPLDEQLRKDLLVKTFND